MLPTKYVAIDKSIIEEGMELGFNIFVHSPIDKEMNFFKDSDSSISYRDKRHIDKTKVLYVKESEYINYEKFRDAIVNTPSKLNLSNFKEHSSKVYENASVIINNLFENQDMRDNYKASKGVVDNLVDIVLDNTFSIKSLMSVAVNDYHTHTHSVNVAIYSLSLGSFLGYKSKDLSELGEAALLHDLGKSKIDPSIINKNGTLNDKEFSEARKHSAFGYAIGQNLGIKSKNVLSAIRHHHEKVDGSGYPSGLKGENIPLYARIIGICDIFDALTSRRSYKEQMSTFNALILIKTKMSNHIDMKLLNEMIKMFR